MVLASGGDIPLEIRSKLLLDRRQLRTDDLQFVFLLGFTGREEPGGDEAGKGAEEADAGGHGQRGDDAARRW